MTTNHVDVDRHNEFLRSLGGVMDPRFDPRIRSTEWTDLVAIRAARELLMGIRYPEDETRRSLYARWLCVIASNEWVDSFDQLMLECLAATPSPTAPERPLFANMYAVRSPDDGPIPDVRATVLNLARLPDLFARGREPVEPLPTSPGIVDYLADLIRKGRASRAALNEAGLIIGFCTLALAVAVPKPSERNRAFFRYGVKRALAAAVPTSFSGELFVPERSFLSKLALKSLADTGVLKPFFVLLVLGQYAYHLNADAAPSADVKFLEEGFLNRVKYTRLEVVELLYAAADKTGLAARELNSLMRFYRPPRSVLKSTVAVDAYLQRAEEPMQKTRPWCLLASPSVCLDLDMCDHLEYAVRLTALLTPDTNQAPWKRPEFMAVSESRVKQTLLWARVFRRLVRGKKNEESAMR